MSLSLRAVLTAYPKFFYPQTWYYDEPFIDHDLTAMTLMMPDELVCITEPPAPNAELPYAAHLALLYIQYPDSPMWANYLWCADRDRHGQRVYVGSNGKGLEIHRHLRLSDRWVIPTWNHA